MIKSVLLVSVTVFFAMNCAFAHDVTTPLDGNLYQPDRDSFTPTNITVYPNDTVLKEHGLSLKSKRIFNQKGKQGVASLESYVKSSDLHINSNVVYSDDGYRVELTGNSDRYYHPILGSADNATGFRVVKGDQVIATYQLNPNQVFETKRALITDIVPENKGEEIVLTVSDDKFGARMEVYSFAGKRLGVSEFVGRSHRWMHLLAVAPFTDLPFKEKSSSVQLALVQTPHIGGILKLYQWNGSELERVNQQRGFSTHTIGSDNLNMAIAANFDDEQDIELLLPSQDFTRLKLVKYTVEASQVIKTFKLPGRLDTNLYLTNNGDNAIWLATDNGKVVKISAAP